MNWDCIIAHILGLWHVLTHVFTGNPTALYVSWNQVAAGNAASAAPVVIIGTTRGE